MGARTFLLLVIVLTRAPGLWGQAAVTAASGITFEAGLPKNGGIGTLFVRGLSLERDYAAEGAPLPRSLGGATVLVGGAEAPPYAVLRRDDDQQINF